MEKKISRLLEEKFKEPAFSDCFVIDVALEGGNKLRVFVDSDSGITLKKCQQINRYLKKHIEEQGWLGDNYSIEVSSPGLSRPLQYFRQYRKNIGRSIQVKLSDGSKTEGVLTAATEKQIILEQLITVKEGKKKKKQKIQKEIAFEEIKKAIVKITF